MNFFELVIIGVIANFITILILLLFLKGNITHEIVHDHVEKKEKKEEAITYINQEPLHEGDVIRMNGHYYRVEDGKLIPHDINTHYKNIKKD